MYYFKKLLKIFAIIVLSSTMVNAVTTDPQKTVDAHNMYRNQLNSGQLGTQPAPNPMIPDLVWDQSLAESADRWAKQCKFGHSTDRNGAGENAAWGHRSLELAVKAWVDEYEIYTYPNGFSSGIGHYTQVVWANTTKVGCGEVYCPQIDGLSWGGNEYICQYSPAGNFNNQPPYKINGSNDAKTNYNGTNGNLDSIVNIGNTGYRVKFDLVSADPIVFRVIAWDFVNYMNTLNRATFDGRFLDINTFTINGQGDYWAELENTKNLDFKLTDFDNN